MGVLQTARLDDVIQHKASLTKKSERRYNGVVCLEHDMTVSQALKLLAKYRILSAPMVVSPSPLEDQETEAARAGTIGYNRPSLAGWCDISDILNGLINQMRKLHPDGKLPTNLLRLMSELDKESKVFINRTLMEIAVGDDKSFLYESERGSSLLEALR
ncbi:hypothetical protein DUNSADRAFT_11093 [Dunaliella salina]|uniref:Uncharacterized protein n=1 Tax=Dunaliella salina TaxID=3046 RepID=A0ABQ7H4I4_DUNSA|nr:hypothetical protein DUNSADRAFT_11093 [Dunaliella salina]|eukprot:KAF5841777.1 hypothetical protein DUNSADRAFT_11093 [Dunaliella salina]